VSISKNPGLTFPIKKRIKTEFFIDWMGAVYIWRTRISNKTNNGGQKNERPLIGEIPLPYAEQPRLQKMCGNERSGDNLSWNEFCWKRDAIRKLPPKFLDKQNIKLNHISSIVMQAISFIFTLQYFNDNVQSLLHSDWTRFKIGSRLVSPSHIYWYFKHIVYSMRRFWFFKR